MKDPIRLKDAHSGSSRALRELLRAGRAEAAPSARLQRIGAGLLTALGSAGLPRTVGAATAAHGPAMALLSSKVGVAVVALSLAAGGGAYALHARATRPVTAALPAEPAALPVVEGPAPPGTPRAEAEGPRPLPRRAASEAPSPPSAIELGLLDRAMAASPAEPARALALAQEHARRFPAGALAQEREVIAIEALVRLGRHAEARARAADFLRRFPDSAHRVRVRALAHRAADGP